MANENIEIRSEKVRHIIGDIPSNIVRYGITVITIIILGLFAGAYYLPYPETIITKLKLSDHNIGVIEVPYKYVNSVKSGMSVNMEFEGYNIESCGASKGIIISKSLRPYQTSSGTIFKAQIKIEDCEYKTRSGMAGTAYILVFDKSILHYILNIR